MIGLTVKNIIIKKQLKIFFQSSWCSILYYFRGLSQCGLAGLLMCPLRLSLYETLSGTVFNSWSWWIEGSNGRNKTIIMLINGRLRMVIWINVLIVISIRGNREYALGYSELFPFYSPFDILIFQKRFLRFYCVFVHFIDW